MPTNAELTAEVKKLRAEKAAAEAQAQDLTKQLQNEMKGKEGWLVTTPNVDYSGTIYDIQFINGQAFIPSTRVFPRFRIEPAKLSTLKQRGLGDQEIAIVRERETRPTAEIVAHELRGDFGYKVEYFDIDHQKELSEAIDSRVSERSTLEQLQKKGDDRAFFPPGY